MKQLNGLPVFKMTISDDDNDLTTGLDFISLVDQPAIEVNWVAMSDKKAKLIQFNSDKQIITGPIMIPNLPIYRFDKDLGEYYVTFEADQIKKMVRKFLRQGKTLGFNYMHQKDSQVETAQIDEVWYIDGTNDKSVDLGYDLPIGTAMVTSYIADSKFWNKEIKSGNVRGFSIEGFLNLELQKINKNKLKLKMTKLTFNAEIKTVDGIVLFTPGDSFVETAEVYVVDADGNQTPAPDGDHVLENGETITVKDGKITAVIVAEAQADETSIALVLEPSDIDAITAALQPMFDAINARLDALEAANTDMSAQTTELRSLLSKIPGSTSISTKTDDKKNTKTSMSLVEKLEFLKTKQKNK